MILFLVVKVDCDHNTSSKRGKKQHSNCPNSTISRKNIIIILIIIIIIIITTEIIIIVVVVVVVAAAAAVVVVVVVVVEVKKKHHRRWFSSSQMSDMTHHRKYGRMEIISAFIHIFRPPFECPPDSENKPIIIVIKVLEDNFEENKTEELQDKKESLENIRKKYMEGVVIRSKARWI
ncbi:hypothetical protein ElyMa_000121400 [Elysia marginata]|uniref:Uncharacterized protein n=1 Tax=Elysia marginata TaxID=1093978 RepID=A0AAV4EMK6_9GAST|nr:hypothetical protein ElyMa_000121400 [Elysia marginata]